MIFGTKTEMVQKDIVCAFALSGIFRYEPKYAKAAVEILGGTEGIFNLDKESLDEVMGPYNKYRNAILTTDLDNKGEQLEKILEKGFRYIPIMDEAYPGSLRICEDAPMGLFVDSHSDNSAIFATRRVSVVGTRDISPYGKLWCNKIVGALAATAERPAIVSGLAFGADITAHLAALDAGLPTIAVLGSGIGDIYPRQHCMYAERLRETAGCAIISEYPPETDITAINFLSRNRIIAGLSECTVLIESKIKGGGMSTARVASSYSRDVFAVPGRNDDTRSQGCNFLIRKHIAEPLIDCGDFISSLGFKKRTGIRTADISAYTKRLAEEGYDSDTVFRILKTIRSNPGISANEISSLTGTSFPEVLAIVGELESDGMISIDLLQRCTLSRPQ